MDALWANQAPLAAYEQSIRGLAEGKNLRMNAERYDTKSRNQAFRRTVLDAYDYRCAASGWRIILPDNKVLAQAAHLIPFSVAHGDDPRNGISLAPSYHWALDNHLIAPGTDHKWHVSQVLDSRLRDNQALLDLDGKDVLLPRDQRYWPKAEALEWRVERLRG